MPDYRGGNNLTRALLGLVVVSTMACQGMDRLEPDEILLVSSGEDRGTMLDSTGSRDYGSGGRLTEEIAQRRVRAILGARGEERLALAQQFLREYPIAEGIWEVHELIGDAHSEMGQPAEAARAWEKALDMSWPPVDIVGLPQSNLTLPYEIGWAQFEAGNAPLGADWLARATFVSDRPQLEQGLRFVYAELGSPGGDFDAWYDDKRAEFAVTAPDFELPGYEVDSLRLSDVGARLTLINFWSPT